MPKHTKYKLIDLFAGAGGLSLGFSQTNKFEIKAAVEKNPNAQKTYQMNFQNVDIYDDIIDIDFKEFERKYGKIDVVIGGPPCQGFSNANRQHNQAINQNNKLVKQYIRAILELHPKAFLMENVSMLKSDVHKFYIENGDWEYIKKYNIPVNETDIFLLSKEYMFSGVTDLIGDVEVVKKCMWDLNLYKLLNILYKNRNNKTKLKKAFSSHKKEIRKLISIQSAATNPHIEAKSKELFRFINDNDQFKSDDLIRLIEEPLNLQMMLQKIMEIYNNDIDFSCLNNNNIYAKVHSCAVFDYLTCILGASENGYAISQGILSAVDFGIPQKRKRFVIIGVMNKFTLNVALPTPLRNTVHTTVKDAIKDLEKIPAYYSVEEDDESKGIKVKPSAKKKIHKLKSLRRTNGKVIYNHVIPKTTKDALERFKVLKQGENFHSLPKDLKENTYTNAERTQNTVYARLKYNEASGTVVNVRKSMWVHPTENRAVSIREAARLQTFPDSFRFYGPKDSEYQQVGNAVPPMLSNAIAKQILSYIDEKK